MRLTGVSGDLPPLLADSFRGQRRDPRSLRFADLCGTGICLAPNHLDTALALYAFDRKGRTARYAEHIDIYAVVVAEATIGGLIALHRAKNSPVIAIGERFSLCIRPGTAASMPEYDPALQLRNVR